MVSEDLLQIIDERAKKMAAINRTIYLKAVVAEVYDNGTKAAVIFAADNTRHTLLNKTGERLSTGDGVFIEIIGGDMQNAVIHMRFGKTRPQTEIDVIDNGGYITLQLNGATYNLIKYTEGT